MIQYGWTVSNISSAFQLPIELPQPAYVEDASPNQIPSLALVLLPPPTLNITQPWRYLYNQQVYSSSYIEANSKCMPLSTYQWGFSWYVLLVLSITTAIWALGMYIMWMDTHRNSRFDQAGEIGTLGTFKAVMDLSSAIRAEFDPAADKYTNQGLLEKVKHTKDGMIYSVEGLPLSRSEEREVAQKGKSLRMGNETLKDGKGVI